MNTIIIQTATPTSDPQDAGAPDPHREEHPQVRQEGAGGANGDALAPTYAEVATALSRAANRDKLDEAASLINGVANEVHRHELNAKYAERARELER